MYHPSTTTAPGLVRSPSRIVSTLSSSCMGDVRASLKDMFVFFARTYLDMYRSKSRRLSTFPGTISILFHKHRAACPSRATFRTQVNHNFQFLLHIYVLYVHMYSTV